MKYLIYKNNAEKNGTFHMQIMLKAGNKCARIIWDTYSKLSMQGQKWHQVSVIPAGVLIANF